MKTFFDAFISYGRIDSKEFAITLKECLEQQGLKIWFDFDNIPYAVDFQNQINDGISRAHNFIFIISPHAVNSPYCLQEIELAIQLKKRIIPLLHVMQISRETWQQRNPKRTDEAWEEYRAKGLHESYPNMHPIIRQLNWLPFEEKSSNFEDSCEKLIDLLSSHREYVQQHTDLLAKAIEWEQRNKQNRYLLIGEEKQQALSWLKIRFKDEQPPCIPSDLHCEYITESLKNANNLMTQVFLAYTDDDRDIMDTICKGLRREGITVWHNDADIQSGEAFEESFCRGIEQADNIIYLLSQTSIDSYRARRNLNYALSLHKRIIPILVEEVPSPNIPAVLQNLQYIDLTDNENLTDYWLDESQLLKILNSDAAYYNEHKILLTKAIKWKQQSENPSILLRGYNLRSAKTWLQVAQTLTQHPPTPLQEEFITQSLRQPPLESLDVFICYSSADSDLARQINDRLQMQGKMTWFDQESIASGTDFQKEIYLGIQACDNFVFIISPRSIHSPYCAGEVEYAASLNKRFVTVLNRRVKSGDLHPELAKVQWIDFNGHDRDFNANFNPLVRTLDTDRQHVHSHTKWLQRALEWEDRGRSDDLLLRGSESAFANDWLQETEQERKKPAATTLQQEFIEASQNAIAAAQAEEKRRRDEMLHLQEERTKEAEARLAQEKQHAQRQKMWLGAVSTALVGTVAASFLAFSSYQESERQRVRAETVAEKYIQELSRSSLLLNDTGRKFDALLEAIRAKALLNNLTTVRSEIEASVLTALQATVYSKGFREYNRLTGHNGWVYDASFSPDGTKIASGSVDDTIKLWSVDGQLLRTFSGHDKGVSSVVWSPDGQTIASASADGTVKLWSIDGKDDGKPLRTFSGHDKGVSSVVWSPDGQIVASASHDNTIKLWSIDGKLLQTFTKYSPGVDSVSFSPDSKMVAFASLKGTVALRSINGKEVRTFTAHPDGINSIAWSPDGQTIATASNDNTIKLWGLDGKELQTLEGHTKPVFIISFSPDGQTLVSASSDNTIKVWGFDGEQHQTLTGHGDVIWGVSFSPNGKSIVSASFDGTIRLWKAAGLELPTLGGEIKAGTSLAWSPNGKTIATIDLDNTVHLWKVATDKRPVRQRTLEGHQARIDSISFSPDSKTVAFATLDGSVQLWSVDGVEPIALSGFTESVSQLAWSRDGKTLVCSSVDGTLTLWKVETGKMPVRQQTLTGHSKQVNSIVVSPEDRTLASASQDGTVKLWDMDTDNSLVFRQTLTNETAAVNSVSFSPDGKAIATADDNNTVKLWNLDGTELRTFSGHADWVSSVAWSPDGQIVASTSWDGTVKLWNVETIETSALGQTLIGHERGVYDVVWSPDSQMLASASEDGTAILWNRKELHPDKLVQNACQWVYDYLKHNPEDSHHQLCSSIESR